MLNIKDKNILILGAGKTGISTAKFLLKKDVKKIVLSDIKSKNKLNKEVFELEKNGVIIECGGHKESSLIESDIVIVSPGIKIKNEWVDMIKRHNKKLIGEIELSYNFINKNTKIIAITGTNGKTTTTTLVYNILKNKFNDKVGIGGNIGTPFIELIDKNYEYIVLEVSSFQLETVDKFNPFIATILNITEDHLDRYNSIQEYAEAKANIFKNQTSKDFLILNKNDKFYNIMNSLAKSKVIPFSAYSKVENGYFFDGKYFVKLFNGMEEKIMSSNNTKLIGRHNYENILVAIIIADILKVEKSIYTKIIYEFKGLPHRIEYITTINNKKFYNDSKATNTDAVIKALKSFSEPILLILGGREKNTNFLELKRQLPENVKYIISYGENKEKIKKIFEDKIKVYVHNNFQDIVKHALQIDDINVVLLSPGCASFDMFKDYNHRGEEFKKEILKLEKNNEKNN